MTGKLRFDESHVLWLLLDPDTNELVARLQDESTDTWITYDISIHIE